MNNPPPPYRYKIHEKLYDLTDFVNIHPGGVDVFRNLKPDTNITAMIYSYHKDPKSILKILPTYEVSSNDILIQYDTNYTYDTYCELKRLVYDEIHEKKIPLYWSTHEIAYNAFMLNASWAFRSLAQLPFLPPHFCISLFTFLITAFTETRPIPAITKRPFVITTPNRSTPCSELGATLIFPIRMCLTSGFIQLLHVVWPLIVNFYLVLINVMWSNPIGYS